jgi:hypothetical protein
VCFAAADFGYRFDMSEDLGTEPLSEEYDGPDPTEQEPKPGSEQVVGDDESDYGGAGAKDAERGPSDEDEDQGI